MPEMTFEQRVEMFRRTADNVQARMEYAASRAAVINPLLDEQSTVRAIFKPERLPRGSTPTYPVPFEDIDCTWIMPQIGGVPVVQVEGTEIHVDTFGMDGGVEWQIDIARDGRFEVGRLATNLLKNKFIQLEEMAGWGLIKAHAAALPNAQKVTARDDSGATSGTKKLNIFTINEAITAADELGIGGRRITDIYVSPRRFGDLRSAIGVTALPESLRQQIWGNGKGSDSVADIRIHRVYNAALVWNDFGYAFTQKDGFTYGVMPVRDPLETVDNPIAILEWKMGVIGRQRLGFGVLDDKGLIQIAF